MVHLSKQRNQRCYELNSWLCILLVNYHWCPFPVPGFKSGCYITFSHQVSSVVFFFFGCLLFDDFCRFSLFSKTLTIWRSASQVFCERSFKWDFSDIFFSWLDQDYVVLWGRPQEWNAIVITSSEGYVSTQYAGTLHMRLV